MSHVAGVPQRKSDTMPARAMSCAENREAGDRVVLMPHRDQNATGSVAANTRYRRGASPAMGGSASPDQTVSGDALKQPRLRPYFLSSLWRRLRSLPQRRAARLMLPPVRARISVIYAFSKLAIANAFAS